MTTTAIQAAAGSQTGKNGSAASGAAAGAPLVLVGAESGITLIPQPTDLTRLNYFDGKFLRAADLNAEQDYLRSLVALSNRAGGSGIVHGFDVTNSGTGTLTLTAGLAIDPKGRVVWMPYDAPVNLAQLIERSREAIATSGAGAAAGAESFAGCAPETVSAQPPGGTGLQSTDLYLITVSWAEALCGEADVYGKLCEDACITSTDRPFRLEGLVVRAVPLSLGTPSCTAQWLTAKHRRSLVASAYFADERAAMGAAMSGARIRNGPWCVGATAATGDSIPLAIVSVSGSSLQFLDEWTARRERIETPPHRYWQWQLAMRPKAVFLAQLLQFQCQLRDLLTESPLPKDGGNDPCGRQRDLLRQTEKLLAEVQQQYRAVAEASRKLGGKEGDYYRPEFMTSLGNLRHDVGATLTQLDAVEMNRVLLEGGIVELPPAGYLPVAPGPVDVKTQVQRLLGEGVELRVCSVRPDYVPHALEEAQHMERICLLQGLENPENRPRVDILVPDGLVSDAKVSVGGIPLQVKVMVDLVRGNLENSRDDNDGSLFLSGAARAEALVGGGAAFHFAGRGEVTRPRRELKPPVEGPQVGVPSQPQAGPAVPRSREAPAAAPAAFATADAREVLAKAKRSGPPASAEPTESTAPSGLTAQTLRRIFTRSSTQAKGTPQGGISGFQTQSPPTTGSPPQTGSPPETGSPPYEGSPPETADYSPSLWATVRVGGDPFALAIGDSLPLHGEFALSFEEGRQPPSVTAAEVVVDADLYRDQGSGNTLTGRARGFAVLRSPGQAPDSSFESFPVELSIQPASGGGGTLTVTIDAFDESRLRFVTTWSPRPTTVVVDGDQDWIDSLLARLDDRAGDAASKAAIRERIARLEKEHPELHHVPFLHAEAVENPEVLKPGNAHHERAVSALADLQELLKEPGFRAAGEAKLFAPSEQVLAASSVRATRDWVLFHRRRDNSCDCTCAHDETQVLRRYRLYHVQVPERVTVGDIRAALASGREIPGMSTVPVIPRFAADGTALLSTRREVLDAWHEMDLGSEIVYGAVAAAGAGSADPGALLDGRLEALGRVLDDMTPAPHAVYEALPAMPPALDPGGVDGVMLLVTQARPVKTHCHRVYAFSDGGVMDWALRKVAEGSGLGEVLKNSFDLGSVDFNEGSGTPNGPLSPLLAAWNTHWPDAAVGRAATVVAGSSAPAWAGQQGTAIAQAFGVGLGDGAVATVEQGFSNCPVITLLEPGPASPPTTMCHELYRLKPGWTMPRLAQLDEQGGVAATLGEIAWKLGVFHFEEGSAVPNEGVAAVKAAWDAHGAGTPEFGATFSTEPLGSPRFQVQTGQGMALNQAMGGPMHANPWTTAQPVSSGCDVATLVAEQTLSQVHHMYRVVNQYVSPDYAWPVMKMRIAAGDLAGALALDPQWVRHIGDIRFADGTTQVSVGDLPSQWSSAGAGIITAVGTVYHNGLADGWKQVLRDQTRALSALAGDTSTPVEVVETSQWLDSGAITVLVVRPDNWLAPSGETADCHGVYRFNEAMTGDDVTRLRKTLQEPGGVARVLASSTRLGRADFSPEGTGPSPQTEAQVKSWRQEVTAGLTVVSAQADEEAATLAGARTAWIAGAASGGTEISARAPVRVEEALPVECETVTLLFFE